MAARVYPEDVRSAHQSMHHLVAHAEWSDEALLATVTGLVLPALTRGGDPCTWIYRRHWLSEERDAFGWRGTAILRTRGQD